MNAREFFFYHLKCWRNHRSPPTPQSNVVIDEFKVRPWRRVYHKSTLTHTTTLEWGKGEGEGRGKLLMCSRSNILSTIVESFCLYHDHTEIRLTKHRSPKLTFSKIQLIKRKSRLYHRIEINQKSDSRKNLSPFPPKIRHQYAILTPSCMASFPGTFEF